MSTELLKRFEELHGAVKPGERALFERSQKGLYAHLGEELPDGETTRNVIRASFIRWLLLIYSARASFGEVLRLRGAFIEGKLDLDGLCVTIPIALIKCRFTQPISFRGTEFKHSVGFSECALTSLSGQRLSVNGDLAFIKVQTRGTVNLLNAQISASLKCAGSQFDGQDKKALIASGAEINSVVQLTKEFSAKGGVIFRSAKVGGSFDCGSGTFWVDEGESLDFDKAVIGGSVFLHEGFSSTGTIRMSGVRIFGQLSCINGRFDGNRKGHALNMERGYVRNNVLFSRGCEVIGGLFLAGCSIDGNLGFDDSSIDEIKAHEINVKGRLSLSDVRSIPKLVSLWGAKISSLHDDLKSWGGHPILNGFAYEAIDVNNPMPVSERIVWLKSQKTSYKPQKTTVSSQAENFRPQPWRQLQQVLESMGRTEEAKEIAIEYEHCLRRFGLIGQTPGNWYGWYRRLYAWWARCLHICYGRLTGFGYRPMVLLPWFALVWAFCTLVYWGAASAGIFAPSNPLIFQNEAYETCRPDREQVWLSRRHDRLPIELPKDYKGEGNWYLCNELREEYTGFSPIAFSLDLLLPLVDLHQENDWAPLIETPKANPVYEFFSFFISGKRFVRFVMWCEILAGWGFSLLFVAVVSGLARRKE